MRRPSHVAIRAGLYVAATISGVAAAYVVTELILNLRDSWNPGLSLPQSHDDGDSDGEANHDMKAEPDTLGLSARHDIGSSLTSFGHASVELLSSDHTVDLPTSVSEYPQLRIPSPSLESSLTDWPAPSTENMSPSDSISPTSSEAKFSPPLSSPRTWPVFGSEDSNASDDDDPQLKNSANQEAEIASFATILSPSMRTISPRHVRAHDLFSASHLSFAELGSLMAGERHG